MISYFLHDQSMQIHEQQIRNSGIVEGKFLIRGKYRNESTGNYFHPTEFQLHSDIVINKYSFHIDGIDEGSRKYMAQVYHAY